MLAQSYRWTCRCCGETRHGLPMDIGYEHPDGWLGLTRAERELSSLEAGSCIITHEDGKVEHYLLAAMPVPVPETGDEFRFMVWVSVSQKSWNAFRMATPTAGYEIAGCFGYLAHNLPDMPRSFGLHASVEFLDFGSLPVIYLHDHDHPLVDAQTNGVNLAQVERWALAAMAH